MRCLYVQLVYWEDDVGYLWNDADTCSPKALQNSLSRSDRPVKSTILRHMLHTSYHWINAKLLQSLTDPNNIFTKGMTKQ